MEMAHHCLLPITPRHSRHHRRGSGQGHRGRRMVRPTPAWMPPRGIEDIVVFFLSLYSTSLGELELIFCVN